MLLKIESHKIKTSDLRYKRPVKILSYLGPPLVLLECDSDLDLKNIPEMNFRYKFNIFTEIFQKKFTFLTC